MNINKSTNILLVAFLLVATFQNNALAQRKKKNQREPSEKKEQYDISILLPFDNSRTSNNANSPVINYYEGIKLGLQELDNEGNKLKIQTHVLDQSSTLSFQNFAYQKELKNADLIIAPVSGNVITDMVNYANEEKINFISTFSPFNGNDTPSNYFHILQPTLQSNINCMVEYSKKNFPKTKKIIIYSDKETQNYGYIKDALKSDKRVINFNLKTTPLELKNFINILSPNEPNVLFVATINPTQTEEILKVLNEIPETYQLEIFGLPTLYLNTRLKNKDLPNTNYYYSAAFHYDQNTALIKKINQMYQEKYNKPANDLVYRGYETIVWYAKILKKYGNQFQYSKYDNMDSPYTPFNFKDVKNDNKQVKYFENKYLYIYKYNEGIQHIIEP